METTEQRLLRLEKSMLDPSKRTHFEELAHLLDDGFIEFGSSGQIYDKRQVIAAVKAQAAHPRAAVREASIGDFQVRRLSPELVLVTFTVTITTAPGPANSAQIQRTRRSSIWRLEGEMAQIIPKPYADVSARATVPGRNGSPPQLAASFTPAASPSG